MEDYKPELRRQSSEKVMWDAVLKDGKKSPSEQNIVDIFNRTGLSIKDAQQQARKEIEKKKKSTPMEKKELDEFLKKTKATLGTSNPFKKELAIKATEKTKRYKESKNMSKRLHKKTGGRRKTRKKKRRRKRGGNDKSITLSIKENQWNQMTLPQKIYYIKNLNPTTDKNRDGSRVTDQQKDMVVSYLTNPKLFDQMAMKEEIKPLFYFEEEPQLTVEEINKINPHLVNKKGGKRRKKTRKKRRKKRRKTKKKKKRKTKKRYRNQRGCKR